MDKQEGENQKTKQKTKNVNSPFCYMQNVVVILIFNFPSISFNCQNIDSDFVTNIHMKKEKKNTIGLQIIPDEEKTRIKS